MPSYYPKNKILNNQYTAGKKYSYPSGIEYVGYYYVLSNGKVFSGKTPQDPNSVELVSYAENIGRLYNPKLFIYNDLTKNTSIAKIQNFKSIPSYYPILTENDYKLGIITRYFCNKLDSNSTTIKEISKEIYTSLINQEPTYDYISNIIAKIPWKITGPLYDVYQNNILIQPGIVDTNSRQLAITEKTFPGISDYLNNLTEFIILDREQK